jgi:hypothetical protein
MEAGLGGDFSDVRIHDSDAAAESATALDAKAYTVGTDIVFAHGEYAPESVEGRRTLAHELTHVEQQRSGPVAGQRFSLSSPGDAFELAADDVASRLVSGAARADTEPRRHPGAVVQRQVSTGTTKTAPAPQTRPASAAGAINPTYDDARDYARTYFRRRGELENMLAEMRDTAFRKFEEVTSEAFNAESHVGLELLQTVLMAVPEAGPLLKALQGVAGRSRVAVRLKAATKTVEKIEETVKPIKAGGKPIAEAREAVHKGAELEEKREQASETIEVLGSLADLRVEETATRWEDEDTALETLARHQHDPPDRDLLAQVQRQLGPLPRGKGLKPVADQVEEKFELELFRHHYSFAGAFWNHRRSAVGRIDRIEHIPARALEYIMTLGKYADHRELAKAWRLLEDTSSEPTYHHLGP